MACGSQNKAKNVLHMGDSAFCESEPYIQQALQSTVENVNEHINWIRSDMEGSTIDNHELRINEIGVPNSNENF